MGGGDAGCQASSFGVITSSSQTRGFNVPTQQRIRVLRAQNAGAVGQNAGCQTCSLGKSTGKTLACDFNVPAA